MAARQGLDRSIAMTGRRPALAFSGELRQGSRPTLAYVVNSLNPGGTEKLVVEMSLAFCSEFGVVVLCLDEPGLWADDLRSRGIPVHCLWRQPGLDFAVAVRLANYFRRFNARIIHAHQTTPWFYAALSRLLHSGPKLLFEEHGRFFPEVKKLTRVLVNRLLVRKLTHRFVAVSRDIRERLREYEGLDAHRIEIIYNGVRTEPLLGPGERDALRSELGFTPGCFVIGTVGRFDPIKNLPMLVAGLARASKEVDALHGLLVGDGPVFPEIRSLVEKAGLRDRVRLTGFRGDARKLIGCMDLFVLSSFSEGTSMALLEAMMAGVPVVVTGVGGNPEIVVDGESGWVIPSNSVDALAAAILESAGDAQKRQKIAAAGKRRFEDQFAFDRMIESYRNQYRTLLSVTA
jgi:glycosyltransferase involved in cell wall biosynthesis